MRAATLFAFSLSLFSACAEHPDPGLLGTGVLLPYPSSHLEVELDGVRSLDFSEANLPVSVEGDQTPFPIERLTRLDGFPLSTPIIVPPLGGLNPDPTLLPTWPALEDSVADTAPILLLDLESGEAIPYFAELDAWPDAAPERRALMIHPLGPLPAGGHVAVVLTTALMDPSGQPMPRPANFEALVTGKDLPPGLKPFKKAYRTLFDRLEELGLALENISLAWDFHVASTQVSLAPLDGLLNQMRAQVPMDASFNPTVTLTRYLDSDLGDVLPVNAWRLAEYDIEMPAYIDDDGNPNFGADGLPELAFTQELHLEVMVPESLKGAPAGAAPVLIFGHGLLADPDWYLGNASDEQRVNDLANALGAVAMATRWRGLTLQDVPDALRVAIDIGRFNLVTDRLLQGVTNALMLERFPATAIADLPVFQSDDGQGSLTNPDRILYYGISLGGIEGSVLTANAERVEAAVMHVPGSNWSTMLERSSNWAQFEPFAARGVPDPLLRQVMYAVLQNLWDPVDPVVHAAAGRFAGKTAMWQESMGDEEVPNVTTELLVRAGAIPLVTPSITEPWGLDIVAAPAGPLGLYQYDSGIAPPPFENRPAPVSGAHKAVRHHDEHHEQTVTFLQTGVIVDACDGPCVWDDGP